VTKQNYAGLAIQPKKLSPFVVEIRPERTCSTHNKANGPVRRCIWNQDATGLNTFRPDHPFQPRSGSFRGPCTLVYIGSALLQFFSILSFRRISILRSINPPEAPRGSALPRAPFDQDTCWTIRESASPVSSAKSLMAPLRVRKSDRLGMVRTCVVQIGAQLTALSIA
jgi:hypothetical protein